MANPTGSVSYDKSSYHPGETMTATVSYADADSKTGVAAFDLTDAAGHVTPAQATFTVSDPVDVTPKPSNDRTWVEVAGSDTGASVKFTATA
jgi:hypothetical protein